MDYGSLDDDPDSLQRYGRETGSAEPDMYPSFTESMSVFSIVSNAMTAQFQVMKMLFLLH